MLVLIPSELNAHLNATGDQYSDESAFIHAGIDGIADNVWNDEEEPELVKTCPEEPESTLQELFVTINDLE